MIEWQELIISVFIVTGIATLLAALMAILDATVGNYGEKKLTINSEKEVIVQGGETLLAALRSAEIFIPSACGGRGSCGLCKVQVDQGGGDYLPTELSWIDAQEQKQNIRLSCQLKVKRDMALTIDKELLSVRQFQAEVSSLKKLTHDIMEVTLSLPEGETIDFSAGQFIQLEVPEYEHNDEPVYRAYSIASPPSQESAVTLQIKKVEGGVCTTWVHDYLKEGDTVLFNGPYGDFTLRDSENDIIFMATGSGMAPIRSILLDMAEKGCNRKATYFFGCREHCDLFLLDEMDQLMKKMQNFTFVPALSRPEEGLEWHGEKGRLDAVLPRYIKNGSESEAYLCAGSRVISAYKDILHNIGVEPEKVFYDDFG